MGTVGRGPLGSLRVRVRAEIRELYRDNKIIRRARRPPIERLLRSLMVGRSVSQLLFLYVLVVLLALGAEWWITAYWSRSLPDWYDPELPSVLRDIAGFFIAAQVGILAIVTVAVGVVTLLSQRNDGASATTNIRLYYTESYSYEVAISGIALLLVLVLPDFLESEELDVRRPNPNNPK